VKRHHPARTIAPSAKRYATETSGDTTPSWNLIANHVEPQISVEIVKSETGERNDTRRF